MSEIAFAAASAVAARRRTIVHVTRARIAYLDPFKCRQFACYHQPSGSASDQVDHRRQQGFPGCRPKNSKRWDICRVVISLSL